jgi:hypothetical protein
MQLDFRFWDGIFYDGRRPTAIATRAIIGYRLNRHADGALVSVSNVGYTWKPGPNLAICRSYPTKHHAPGPACQCGLYAYRDLGELLHNLAPGPAIAQQLILACVAGRGIVRIHERGWRAQYARIVALCDELPALVIGQQGGKLVVGHELIRRESARSLGKTYRVPVVPLSELLEVMRAFGDFAEEMPWT